MPVTDARGAEREALTQWWKTRVQEIEQTYEERIRVLRTVGEHPSPVFAKIVRMDGALGMPKKLLAMKLGISVATLVTHYGDEYDLGASEVISQVAANMLRIGTSIADPNNARVGMQILDRRGGEEWKPPSQKVEMKTDTGSGRLIDSSKLTPEEREQLRAMIIRQQSDAEEVPLLESDTESADA
jgi:DNA-binding CsgD family transcriptional regulator